MHASLGLLPSTLHIVKVSTICLLARCMSCDHEQPTLLLPDVNECAEILDDCSQVCIDTVGSYSCDCLDGFILQADETSCDGQQCGVPFSHAFRAHGIGYVFVCVRVCSRSP